ncbi:NADPH-dependent F420 reductase [Parvularcula lutaonensis]|uniref:NADPH-dependent F420 reductase n=1 Tax=Parvularcula lutaonensis TaxID=491923 RepID=A0ABV7M946_9PROT|nr:NAD(P)-binding domain-containing protein [Parvularcula lutaonensis]GGY41178.1 hypothetical protein GCM10007148_07200 [Parvularcula lutaonensis]
MRIAIVGAGNVGRALGGVWHRAGHEIVWNLRNPDDPKYADLPGEKRKTVGSGLTKSDVTVLAVPWSAIDDACAGIGENFGGILVDATNPINESFDGLDRRGAHSGAQYIKQLLPRARVVKAFNHTTASNMANADYPGGKVLSLVCANDEVAASVVRQLSDDLGFDTVVVRGLEHARQLEELAWLVITLAIKQGHGTDFAFSLLRR